MLQIQRAFISLNGFRNFHYDVLRDYHVGDVDGDHHGTYPLSTYNVIQADPLNVLAQTLVSWLLWEMFVSSEQVFCST